MGLNASKVSSGAGGKQFTPQANIEPGVYPARLVQLIDLGLQAQRAFQGKDKPPAQEFMLTYELVDEFMKDEKGEPIEDKPRWISETLPFHSLEADKAKSTLRYFAFDTNKEFNGDWTKVIGAPCNVTVVNNASGDKVYDNVAGVSAMRPRDAARCPELKNPIKVFDLDTPDMEVFNKLPKWVQDKIKGNLNFNGSPLQAKLGEKPKDAPKKEAESQTPPWEDTETAASQDGDVPY